MVENCLKNHKNAKMYVAGFTKKNENSPRGEYRKNKSNQKLQITATKLLELSKKHKVSPYVLVEILEDFARIYT